MSTQAIKYKGTSLPTSKAMATFIDFKHEAGYDLMKEPHRIDSEGIVIMAYCAARAAAEVKGETLEVSMREFSLNIDANELNRWFAAFMGEAGEVSEEDKKKS